MKTPTNCVQRAIALSTISFATLVFADAPAASLELESADLARIRKDVIALGEPTRT